MHILISCNLIRPLVHSVFIRPKIVIGSGWVQRSVSRVLFFDSVRGRRAHRARSRRVRLVCHPSEAPSFPGTGGSVYQRPSPPRPRGRSWDNSVRVVGHVKRSRALHRIAWEIFFQRKHEGQKDGKNNRGREEERARQRLLPGFKISTVREDREKTTSRSAKLKEETGVGIGTASNRG